MDMLAIPLVIVFAVVNASIRACVTSSPTTKHQTHHGAQAAHAPTTYSMAFGSVMLCNTMHAYLLFLFKQIWFVFCVSVAVSFSEPNDRSYLELLDDPLVVYSGCWAVTCNRPCYTRF